jgi:hypothetical protein
VLQRQPIQKLHENERPTIVLADRKGFIRHPLE